MSSLPSRTAWSPPTARGVPSAPNRRRIGADARPLLPPGPREAHLRAGGGSVGHMSRPVTLGQLRESGWESVPVKEEVRRNAVARISAGEPLFPEVLGYEE